MRVQEFNFNSIPFFFPYTYLLHNTLSGLLYAHYKLN